MQVSGISLALTVQNSSDFFRKCGYENHAHAFFGKGGRFILTIVDA